MNRTQVEKDYWNKAALDPDVDEKYIADVPVELCKQDLGKLEGKVLEIGCGVGRLLEDGWWGIDTSIEMIEIARQRGHENVIVNDGRTIPLFPPESFDYVYSYLVFQHLPKNAVQSYINEAYRVLVPGGTLIFQCILGEEDEPFSKHLPPDEIKDMVYQYKTWEMAVSNAYDKWRIVRCVK